MAVFLSDISGDLFAATRQFVDYEEAAIDLESAIKLGDQTTMLVAPGL